MRRIDLVSSNKNHKFPEIIWYFKMRVNKVSMYNTTHISDIFTEVDDISCPKIASFHKLWLKGHEKLSSTTKFERL